MWRAVPGFDFLEVTCDGRVRKYDRKYPKRLPVEVSPVIYKSGYYEVKYGGRRVRLHRLVCLAFHGEPPSGSNLALHKDDNRSNNHIDNLYWGNYSDNAKDAYANKKLKAGQDHPNAKLTWAAVVALRADAEHISRHADIAAKYGVSKALVQRILAGKAWVCE